MGKRQNNRIKNEFFDKQKEREKQKKSVVKDKQDKDNVCGDNNISNLDYVNFFLSKNSKKMILYDKFPDLDTIIKYYSDTFWNNIHPLEEFGKFEIKELLEVIKLLYSIKRQENYKILTTGFLTPKFSKLLDGSLFELVPNIYFLVGNDKTLDDCFGYQNLFLEEVKDFQFAKKYTANFIAISPKQATIRDTLDISCQCPNSDCGYYGGIQYYDELVNNYNTTKYLSIINIFDDNFYNKISRYSGIQDTLSFTIYPDDEFIAKVLLSIVIYKKNHHKQKLSNDDYRYIFYELFKENVNVEKEITKDFPKVLKYVSKR